MKRPTRSRFMGQSYTISFDPVVTVDGEACFGACSSDNKHIRVREDQKHDQERDTVLHECFHQMIDSSGMELTLELEEKIVTYLASATIGHMRDNPTLWKYLAEPPKET